MKDTCQFILFHFFTKNAIELDGDMLILLFSNLKSHKLFQIPLQRDNFFRLSESRDSSLTGRIVIKEGHARLQQIGEHSVVEIAA